MKCPLFVCGVLIVLAALRNAPAASEATMDVSTSSPPVARIYQFVVQYANKTINCQTKTIVTVNGQYPGPAIYATEGDRIIVNVTNRVKTNITIHFHGIRQDRSVWMDGVSYVTMCPIQTGDYFIHDFIITTQKGTLFWHAHISWQRATVHGPIIIAPLKGSYPFKLPRGEIPVVLGEWWYDDVEQVEQVGLNSGLPFQTSDAITINGLVGPNYNCSSSEGVQIVHVDSGETYLLRIINAALNTQLFFAIANHTLTVVEADAEYVSPFETPLILIGPGQTTNVLVPANQPGGRYYMSVSGYGRDSNPIVKPAAIFQYPNPSRSSDFPFIANFPLNNDTGVAASFTNSLKSLYPGKVPLTVDRYLFFVVGLSQRPCLPTQNCTLRGQGEINNITFQLPSIALLQASYFNVSGVFTEDFPDSPENPFDYTSPFSPPPLLRDSQAGTRLVSIEYNDTVQIVMQDTMVLGFEDHPFHLHGNNFHILGQGFGNYDATIDPLAFNLLDPPVRNTVGVPYRGWVAIRIRMNNPGRYL